jgi:hypothetical protein
VISVQSLIKVDDVFIPALEFDGPVDDPVYLEGAIVLVMDGVSVLDAQLWDYIVLLWALLIGALEEAAESGFAKTGLPGQWVDILIYADREAGRTTVDVRGKSMRRGSCGYDEFFIAVCAEARTFSTRMAAVIPERSFSPELERLDRLQRRWPPPSS